ncbi:MAG: lamin tail domain-containing protein, partial [Patescibacteria group bacterium]
MKYYFFVIVILFGSFFIAENLLAINSDIVINEIGAYPTSTHEWIEIWNPGIETIDMKDWKFWENNTNHNLQAVSSSDSLISAGEFAAICQDADVFLSDHPNFIGSVFDSSWTNLNESGEDIGLKDGAGNFVEQFSYVATNNFSLERKDPLLDDYSLNNWQENIFGNTIGGHNSNYLVIENNIPSSTIDSTTTLNIVTSSTSNTMENNEFSTTTAYSSIFDWSFIKLNEVISDPIDGNERVELFNVGSSTVNLLGGSICDSAVSGCKPLSGLILSHDWLVVDLLTDRYLNNSGDLVILRDRDNNVIDQIDYGVAILSAPEKGQSLIRKIDGKDFDSSSDWAVTNKITLDFANELVVPVLINSNNNSGGGGIVTNNTDNILVLATSTKSNKISTTSKSSMVETKDPVNISWKLDWPYGLDVGEVGVFSVKGSADPRGGDINFIWNFGDNTSSTGYWTEHSFASSGIYLVSVLASSSAGTIGKKEFKVYIGQSFSVKNAQIKIGNYQVTSTEDSSEYIELKNYLDKSQNISGWKIKNKSGKEYDIPERTIISPSGTLKFFRSIHHLSFDKNDDEIRLTSPNDQEVDVVKWKIDKSDKKEIKIASVKTASNWLKVYGVVTVEPKIFGQQFFYISDEQTSFQIYQYKKDFPELKIGDYISVSGEVSEVNKIKRIKIKNRYAIDVLSTNKIITPIDLQLEDIGEELLGSLVKVSGDITEIKSNLMYVDDGKAEIVVYFKKGAVINKQELREGDKVEVIGILNESKDGWQVLPRSLEDFNVVGHMDEVLDDRLATDQNKKNEVTKTYLATTAGGLTAVLLGFLARVRGTLLVA